MTEKLEMVRGPACMWFDDHTFCEVVPAHPTGWQVVVAVDKREEWSSDVFASWAAAVEKMAALRKVQVTIERDLTKPGTMALTWMCGHGSVGTTTSDIPNTCPECGPT